MEHGQWRGLPPGKVAMKNRGRRNRKYLCFADDDAHIIQTCENIMGMYKKDDGSKDEDINNAFLDQLGEHLLKEAHQQLTCLGSARPSTWATKGAKVLSSPHWTGAFNTTYVRANGRNPPGATSSGKADLKRRKLPKMCFKMKGRRKVLYHRVARCEELRNIVHPPRKASGQTSTCRWTQPRVVHRTQSAC